MQDEVGHLQRRGQVDQRLEVLEARVHAAVGDQPDDVDPLGRRRARRAAPRCAASDPSCTARSIRVRSCITTLPGAEVEMADLGVAHLALGQPDRAPAGGQRRGRDTATTARRTPGCRPARRRCPARARPAPSRPARPAPRRAPAATGPRTVRRHQHAPSRPRRRSPPATRRRGSRPPTSAPSTSGSASSSAAFSGLTLPP